MKGHLNLVVPILLQPVFYAHNSESTLEMSNESAHPTPIYSIAIKYDLLLAPFHGCVLVSNLKTKDDNLEIVLKTDAQGRSIETRYGGRRVFKFK